MSRTNKITLISFTVLAFMLHFYAAFADPFLNYWDECFHAVVAKNMVHSPFTPMLYLNEAMPLSNHWPFSGIWLHKPPFFLWQMALSIGVFGAEPWAVRLPSALWMTVLVPMIFRMGKFMVDQRTGLLAAFLFAVAYYPIELVTGCIATDHNDAIFIAMVTVSWWAWFEWLNSKRRIWALLTGVFAACAVLTKWYVGLIVFLPWGILTLGNTEYRSCWREFMLAIGALTIIAGAWIISIWIRFPALTAFQWGFKSAHFSKPIDGHSGDWSFHLDVIEKLIPPWSWWIMLPAIIALIWRSKLQEHRIFLVVTILAVHILFAFAQTKMMGYTMVLFPIYILAIANTISLLANRLPWPKWRSTVTTVAACTVGYLMIDLPSLWLHHGEYEHQNRWEQDYRKQNMAMIPKLEELAELLPPADSAVVFNIPKLHHVQFMFTHGYQSMDLIPDQGTVNKLRNAGLKVVVVQDGFPLDTFPSGIVLIGDDLLRLPRIKRE